MPQFLVAIQLPDDFEPSSVDPAMERDIDVLNEEIVAAGIGVFVGGLRPAREAKSLRAQPDGKVLITDGPYRSPQLRCFALALCSRGPTLAPGSPQ